MTQDERRIFVYRPPRESSQSWQSRWIVESVREWCFSPLGLLCAWLLALGLVLPAMLFVLITLHEDYIVLLLGFGLWLTLGLAVIHWWIPSARRVNARTEGIAAAGWHVAATVATTGIAAWLLVFPDGPHSAYTLADIRPVVFAGAASTLLFGGLTIWLRGHSIARTLRYGIVATSFTAVWMSLWLVAVHAGL